MRKALFFDIDGTVVSDITKKVPESACRALKKAKENGHLLFINTGRTMARIVPELKALPFDGFLCGCGIYMTYHDEVIFDKRLSQKERTKIMNSILECDIDGVLENYEKVYYFPWKSRFEEVEELKTRLQEEGIEAIYDPADELIPKGFSKYTAMEMVCKKFDIDRENTYAFGDSSNDIPMFEFAKHTIAMGAHSKILESYTELITKAVEDDGLEYAMKHYGLI